MDRYSFPGSTRISSGKYDSDEKTVHLVFPDGVRWRYLKVPESVWKRFKKAGSAGQFLATVLDTYSNGPDRK